MRTRLITVRETSIFTRRVEKLLTRDERDALITHLARNPDDGDLIEGLGGVRKVRFATRGKGKSGGVRVIYFHYDDDMPLYALLIYAKNEKADLSGDDRKALAAVVAAIKDEWKARRRPS